MKKIIQIVETSECITALCDDGSVWILGGDDVWERTPDIPQDKAERRGTRGDWPKDVFVYSKIAE